MGTNDRHQAPAAEFHAARAAASVLGPPPPDHAQATHPAGAGGSWSQARREELASSDYRTCLAVLVFYWIDAAFLALYALDGVGHWASALAFVAVGTLVAGGGALVVRRYGAGGLDAPQLVISQAGSALALVLGVAWLDPDFLTLMLLTVVVIIPTAALRITPRGVLVLCALAAAATVAVLGAHGGQLSIPTDTRAQLVLGGLFLLWTMVKAASVNVAGMALRMQLDDSHARLAAALVRIEELAQMDELTGLPNRRRVLAALAEERERHRRNGVGFSVAMLDVDFFKRINDRYGHATGDTVLKVIAGLMKGALRKPDVVGRVGGEEFLLIFTGARAAEDARRAADRVRTAIEDHPWGAVAPDLQVTASIGVALDSPDQPAGDIVARADGSLYQAKRQGRNQVVLADE